MAIKVCVDIVTKYELKTVKVMGIWELFNSGLIHVLCN